MKVISRILAVFFILLWIVVATCYVYIRLNGRQLVENTLVHFFDKPVILKDVHFIFPFGVRIVDLSIVDTLSIKDAKLQIGLPDFVNHRLHFFLLSLSEPVLNFQRTVDSQFILGNNNIPTSSDKAHPQAGVPSKEAASGADKAANRKHKPAVKILIDYMLIERGQIHFSDRSRGNNYQVKLQEVDLKAQNVAFPPHPVKTKIDGTAVLFNQGLPASGSRINAKGWADLYHKDMSVDLDIVESDGKVGLSARMESKNNDLSITGNVQITNLLSESVHHLDAKSSLKELIFSSLQSSGVEIVADFRAQTKMDNIQLDQLSFSGNLGYKTDLPLADGESVPSKGEMKNVGKHFEDLGKMIYKDTVQGKTNSDIPAQPQK